MARVPIRPWVQGVTRLSTEYADRTNSLVNAAGIVKDGALEAQISRLSTFKSPTPDQDQDAANEADPKLMDIIELCAARAHVHSETVKMAATSTKIYKFSVLVRVQLRKVGQENKCGFNLTQEAEGMSTIEYGDFKTSQWHRLTVNR